MSSRTFKKVLFMPCGMRPMIDLSSPVVKSRSGERVTIELSTKICAPYRQKCTNAEGHYNQVRLGTARAPHVQVNCEGCLSATGLNALTEGHIALRRARAEWETTQKVYLHEPSVYEAVDVDDQCLGFVLMPGCDASWLKKKENKVFYNPRPAR